MLKTADRTIDLFEVFARIQTPLSLSELARTLAVPPSSCFNLVQALLARGYLRTTGRRGLYPTRRMFEVATAVVAGDPVVTRLQPLLAELRDATRETVILGTRHGDRAIYLSVVEGPQTIRYIARTGDIKNLHSSAIGKALLCGLPDEERRRVVSGLALDRVTDTTITDGSKLLDDLRNSVARGYAQTSGENVVDVLAIARPIRVDRTYYAVAIAGPMDRMAQALPAQQRRLAKTCAEMTEEEWPSSSPPKLPTAS